MAKCTKQQYERWNAKLSNGFKFDLHYFIMWGEKTAKLYLDFTDGRKLEAKLEYRAERKAGTTFGETGRQIPCLHLSLWRPASQEGMMCSSGMGKSIELGEAQPKKNYACLCAYSAKLDAKDILSLAKEYIAELNNDAIIMA